jgi:hypothetical protein
MLEASDSFLLLAILSENRNTNWNQILVPDRNLAPCNRRGTAQSEGADCVAVRDAGAGEKCENTQKSRHLSAKSCRIPATSIIL